MLGRRVGQSPLQFPIFSVNLRPGKRPARGPHAGRQAPQFGPQIFSYGDKILKNASIGKRTARRPFSLKNQIK